MKNFIKALSVVILLSLLIAAAPLSYSAAEPEIRVSRAVASPGEKVTLDVEFLNDPGIGKNRALSDAIDAVNSYDLILFLEPDVAFVQDGDRSEEIKDNREKYSDQIKDLIRAHGKRFVSVSGSYQDRYITAVTEVEKLLKPETIDE